MVTKLVLEGVGGDIVVGSDNTVISVTSCCKMELLTSYTLISYTPLVTSDTHPLVVPLSNMLIVSVYCTILLLSDDTSSTVHPVSVLNEENEHSKHTLPPVVSVITTDSTPNVSEEQKRINVLLMITSDWMPNASETSKDQIDMY